MGVGAARVVMVFCSNLLEYFLVQLRQLYPLDSFEVALFLVPVLVLVFG